MTLAEEISYACARIEAGRNRLATCANLGGFAHPESHEALSIRRAVKDILATLDKLEAKTPADLIRRNAA